MENIANFIETIFEDQYNNLFGAERTPQSATQFVTLTREEKGTLIAVLQATCVLDNAHITALVLSSDHQNQGLGMSLIQEFEELMRERQITSITLSIKLSIFIEKWATKLTLPLKMSLKKESPNSISSNIYT